MSTGIFHRETDSSNIGPFLHYRGLQQLKHDALRRAGYDCTTPISQRARKDLEWWVSNLTGYMQHEYCYPILGGKGGKDMLMFAFILLIQLGIAFTSSSLSHSPITAVMWIQQT